jgi:hypothetical protein
LLSIISGLLVRVATELAVFLLGEGVGCTAAGSLEELRESQEKGLLNFLPVGAGAGAGARATAGTGGDGTGAGGAGGLFDRASVGGGDHGMGGSALVRLLNDMVLVFSGGGLFSRRESVLCNVPQMFMAAKPAWRSGSCRCSCVVIEIYIVERPGGFLRDGAWQFLLCSQFL